MCRLLDPEGAPTVSIITPTFNRAGFIEGLYRSLTSQTLAPIEWILIDDGSTDETAEIAAALQASSTVPIVYRRKSNGGKHTCLNAAFAIAKGEMVVVVDSDDKLAPTALETFTGTWLSIPKEARSDFAGVSLLCCRPDGSVVGDRFPDSPLDGTYAHVRLNGVVHGDKCDMYRTELIREFRFPTLKDERRVPPSLLHLTLSTRGYATRHVNEVAVVCNYQPDGMTAQRSSLVRSSPKGTLALYELRLADGTLNARHASHAAIVSGRLRARHALKYGPVAVSRPWLHLLRGLGIIAGAFERYFVSRKDT